MTPRHEHLLETMVTLLLIAAESEAVTVGLFRALNADPAFLPMLKATVAELRQAGRIKSDGGAA